MDRMSSKLKICVFAPEIHDTISQEVVGGIITKAKYVDVDISIVAAGGVNLQNRVTNEDARLYKDVLDLAMFDGVIALTGSFSNHATLDEVNQFFKFIPDDFPFINLSVKLPGHQALLTDNKAPLKNLVNHLIEKHNKKRFMFIKGPEEQAEADDRFNGFLEALEENGIFLDENLIFPGNFSPQAGSEAIKVLYDKGLELPDAIVCVDDDTTLGVLSELKKRGVDILKEGISLTGFDNMEYTRSMVPSLTTIDQSFNAQGQNAVDAIIKRIKLNNRDDIYYTPKLVIRESCGCSDVSNNEYISNSQSIDRIYSTLDEVEIEGLETHIDDIMSSVLKYTEDREHNFFKTVDKYIDMYSYNGLNVKTLSDIVSQINRMAIPMLEGDHLHEYLQIIEGINSKIIDTISHERIRDYRSFSEQSSELDAIIMQLSTCYTYNELVEALETNFYYLGIKSMEFTFFYKGSNMLDDLSSKSLDKDDSLNRSIKNYCTLFLPVFTKTSYGYCKLKIVHNSFHIAEVLAFQISRTLYLIELLNDLNDKIFELETSYRDLRATKDLLLESEQLANLGGLVAGFTHEINSPIGVGVTATSHLKEQVREILKLYNENRMKKSELESFLDVSNESADMILSNLNRAASLIQGFKQIAVDQASEILRNFELGSYIKEIIHSLTPVFKTTKHNISVEVDGLIMVESYPGALSQIITNLVQNSLKHGFENIESGNILISAKQINENLEITFRDDGKGIKSEDVDKIFESYYSTKIGQGGSGLGLAIIKDLVENKLKGTITCESSEGKGVKFTINSPLIIS